MGLCPSGYVPIFRSTVSTLRSVLLVTDNSTLLRIEEKVEYRSNQTVNAEGDHGKEEVCKGSRGVACGLKRGVVDDDTTDPAKEEGKKKTSELLIIHFENLL